jgi:hypothetical protein
MECTNGYIHLSDTVMIDDTPPWAIGSAPTPTQRHQVLVLLPAFLSLAFSFWHYLF